MSPVEVIAIYTLVGTILHLIAWRTSVFFIKKWYEEFSYLLNKKIIDSPGTDEYVIIDTLYLDKINYFHSLPEDLNATKESNGKFYLAVYKEKQISRTDEKGKAIPSISTVLSRETDAVHRLDSIIFMTILWPVALGRYLYINSFNPVGKVLKLLIYLFFGKPLKIKS